MSEKFDARGFRGLQPRLGARLLDGVYAEVCIDARLWDGRISNFAYPTAYSGCRPPLHHDRTIQHCGAWYASNPTGNPHLRVTQCGGSIPWGTPPARRPSLQVSPPTCTGADTRYVAYLCTTVVYHGGQALESAPSEATEAVAVCTGTNVSLAVSAEVHPLGVKYRWYRAEAGFHAGDEKETPDNAAWYFVAETSSPAYVDATDNVYVMPASPSLFEHHQPPGDMESLVCTDSGVWAGLLDDELWYTLPGDPMSWGRKRVRRIQPSWGLPRALVSHGDDLYVLTTDKPIHYRVEMSATGPVLQRAVLPKTLPVSSVASISTGYQGVVYASTDGLVVLRGGDATVVSRRWFNADEWAALMPTYMAGVLHADAYVFSGFERAFLMEVGDGLVDSNPHSELVELDLGGSIAGAAAFDADADAVYWRKGASFYRWDRKQHGRCPYLYRTVIQDENASRTYTAGEVHATNITHLEFRYRRDVQGQWQVVRDKVITSNTPFRLQSRRRPEDIQVELSGTADVDSVTLATSMASLRGTPRTPTS